MFTELGRCPRCQAPIFSPTLYLPLLRGLPPPIYLTCSCPESQTLGEQIMDQFYVFFKLKPQREVQFDEIFR